MLVQRGWYPEYVFDEGLPIYTDVIGMDRPVALIGTSEKGYLTARVSVELAADEAGHSSRPPERTCPPLFSCVHVLMCVCVDVCVCMCTRVCVCLCVCIESCFNSLSLLRFVLDDVSQRQC